MRQIRAFPFGLPTAHPLRDGASLAAFVLLALLGSLGTPRAQAQTTTIQTFGPSAVDSYSNIISASDGNLYAVSTNETYLGFTNFDYSCPDGTMNDCTFIHKITPAGLVTQLHTFETDGFGGNGGVPNNDGFDPTPLVEGPDGFLYGSATSGGTAGYGTIFKISTSGVFTVLFTFPNTGTALNPIAPNGAYPSRLIFGSDGNLYGTSQQLTGGYYLFQVTTTGSLAIIAISSIPGDVAPQSLVQGNDGNFYGVNGLAVEQITLGGFINPIHNFVVNQSQTMQPLGSLVEGPDQNFYGTDDLSNSIFMVTPSGSLNVIYALQPVDGQLVSPELLLASDNNFYGTTYTGGITTACPSGTQAGTGIGCGIVYQVTPAGTFKTLYDFLGTSVDGAQPDGWLLQGSTGSLYGTFFNPSSPAFNNAFNLSLTPSLSPPIKIAFSPQNPEPNNQLTVNWSVLNAFSATMQQCHGSLSGGPNNTTAFVGPLAGKLTGTLYNGTYSFTPTVAGSYTFTLNCGGIETGSASVTVGNGVLITTASPLTGGTVSKMYTATVQATGGITPYTWGLGGATTLPAGLSLGEDALGNLYITGTPTQFGSYTVTLVVLDSSTPQQANQKTFQIAIASGLTLAGALGNGQVGEAYNQTASALGGLGPYKWLLASGTLPAGLTLNPNTGAITGTPTATGSAKFSISVADNEGTPATFTQAYTVSISPSPLTIAPYQTFNCVTHSLCTGTFAATGGTPPYTWITIPQAVMSGANPIFFTPPPTITFNPNGSFSGVPVQYADPYIQFDVQVTDSEVPAVSVTGLIELSIASDLAITSIPLPPAYIGTPYLSPAPTATGGTPPYTWSLTAASTPNSVYFYSTPQGQLGSPNPYGSALTTPGDYQLLYTVKDSEGVPASAVMDATLDVLAATVNSVTTLSTSNPVTGTGATVTLTATVTATSGIPVGAVTFYNGSVSLGTATLNATGTASLTTTFPSQGVYSLTASYAGGGSTTGSVSTPITETVVTPSITASISPATLTIASGGSGTLTITLSSVGGYTGTVSLSCGSLPPHIACSFAPPSLTIGAGQTTATDTLTITTNSQTAMGNQPNGPTSTRSLLAMGLLPLSLLSLAGLRRRSSRLSQLLALTLLAVGLGAFCGCAQSALLLPGSYSIPINLQLSGGATQQVSATVIVQ